MNGGRGTEEAKKERKEEVKRGKGMDTIHATRQASIN
jgi:hypothetical protein